MSAGPIRVVVAVFVSALVVVLALMVIASTVGNV